MAIHIVTGPHKGHLPTTARITLRVLDTVHLLSG